MQIDLGTVRPRGPKGGKDFHLEVRWLPLRLEVLFSHQPGVERPPGCLLLRPQSNPRMLILTRGWFTRVPKATRGFLLGSATGEPGGRRALSRLSRVEPLKWNPLCTRAISNTSNLHPHDRKRNIPPPSAVNYSHWPGHINHSCGQPACSLPHQPLAINHPANGCWSLQAREPPLRLLETPRTAGQLRGFMNI